MTDTRPCADCPVRQHSLCGTLADRELIELSHIGHRRQVRRGEAIAWAGDDSLSCGNLLSGVLKLTASTHDGREQTVGLLYPADFVGRPFSEKAEFTVSAVTDSELCVFSRTRFEQLLEDYPAMEVQLLRRTFAALDEARTHMLILGRHTAEEKIAGYLLDMAGRAETAQAVPDGPVTFELPLNRGEMAEVLGLTIETVSRQMTKLKTAGIVKLPGVKTVTIRDAEALKDRAGVC